MMKRFNKIGTLILDLILERSKKDRWTGYSRQNNPKKTLTFLALHIFEIKIPKFQKKFSFADKKKLKLLIRQSRF